MRCPSCGAKNSLEACSCGSWGEGIGELPEPTTSAPGAPASSTGFVGRQREMSSLSAALGEAVSGQGRLVMLEGEPGIGKTRIVQELAARAQTLGVQVLWGRCYEREGAPPYWPWAQVVRSYLASRESQHLGQHLGPGAIDIAQIVPELRDQIPETQQLPPLNDPDEARFRLFNSMASFLQKASQAQTLMMALEDLHWANRASLLLLEFVAREVISCPILIVGTYRDSDLSRQHPLTETLGQLSREPGLQRITLTGLPQAETAEFIKVMSGVIPSRMLTQQIHLQTEGNPFFISEIIRYLLERNELISGSVVGLSDGGIPQGVRDTIGQRLNRLSVQCNRVLTTASILGREFNFRVLSAVGEFQEDNLLEWLDEALAAHVIEDVPVTAERYQFSHALVQQTLARELSSSRRVRLHARAAQVLEGIYGSEGEAQASELAHHFAAAEPVLGTEKLVHYSMIAGEQALAGYAYEEAVAHFQRAQSARPSKDMNAQMAQLYFGLARAEAATLERPHQLQLSSYLQQAFDYYSDTGDHQRAAEIAAYPFGPFEGTSERIARALKMVPSESVEAGRLLSRSITLHGLSRRDYHAAQKAFQDAIGIAVLHEDQYLQMQTLVDGACVDASHLQIGDSLEKNLKALELTQFVEQPVAEVHSLFEVGYCFCTLGDLESAIRYARSALATAQRVGNRFWLTTTHLLSQTVANLAGDWQAARSSSDQALEISPGHAALLGCRAVLEYQTGNFGHGANYLELMEQARGTDLGARGIEPNIAVPISSLIAKLPDDQTSWAEIDNRAVLSSPTATPMYQQLARIGLALAAAQRGDRADTEAHYKALGSVQGTLPYLCPYISGDRLLGQLARTAGRIDQAIAHFDEGLAFCRQSGYRPELAWTCYDYADTLIQCGASGGRQKARSLLEESLAISSQLGMKPLQERVQERLGRLADRPKPPSVYPDGLTQREVEVLRLIAGGKSNQEIAQELIISLRTVAHHVTSILTRTGTANRAEAAVYAADRGLLLM